ncbi:glycosyltransferase family 4 protein [Aquimarina sp. W85]|uniref:glycosyltransferase family 4 protein n=1 Tax=Aquimarina rhodophyticola TaxID=3342246 RepID=UPI00367153E6
MRLLYITNQISGAAGLERVLSIKASYLAEKLGYEVHIITLNQKEDTLFYNFSSLLNYHDLKVTGNPIIYLKQYACKIRKLVKKIDPDIISVCDDGLKAFFLPVILHKTAPIVYERHVSKNIEVQTENVSILKRLKTNLTYRIMNFMGSKFDKFVVLTNDNLKEWNLRNTVVISNPLSFYPDLTDTSNLSNKKVLAVGRQCYQKGYDRLLESWGDVVCTNLDWSLEIYGKIEKGDPYADLSKKLGINNSVFFYPPVKNIGEKYQKASIYVMSSRFEGFGMVLIEAMAYGLPCISFNCPCGPEEIIDDGINGFLVPNGNINEFAEKINLLISDKDLRQQMGRAARLKAKSYLPDVILPKWDILFKSLLQ